MARKKTNSPKSGCMKVAEIAINGLKGRGGKVVTEG